MPRDRLYDIWKSMRYRCYNLKCADYDDYGGRGIIMCDEWKNSYKSFHDWGYANGYDPNAKRNECTIDRIDTNGNYTPSNCKWSNQTEQNINRRKQKNNTSGYTEIYFQKVNTHKPWVARISINGKRKVISSHTTQRDALKALNEYIIKNNLPHKIQEYRGELKIINDEQRKVQEEWEKEHRE